MKILRELGRRLRVRLRRKEADRDLDGEIRLHLDLLAQQLRDDGAASATEAATLARRRFGNPARIKEDSRDAPPVIVINEALARRYFGDGNPIGAQTTRGTIVGVVRDVRQIHLDRPAHPEIYFPLAQNWSQVGELGMTLVVRTRDRPDRHIAPVRAAVHEVAPALAVFDIKTLDAVIAESLSSFTIFLWLMTGFALIGLVLACTGVYGVMACTAAARTRELAIRTAVGADRRRVIAIVLGHGGRLTAALPPVCC